MGEWLSQLWYSPLQLSYDVGHSMSSFIFVSYAQATNIYSYPFSINFCKHFSPLDESKRLFFAIFFSFIINCSTWMLLIYMVIIFVYI